VEGKGHGLILIANCRKRTSPENSQCEFSLSWYSSATEESLSAVSDSLKVIYRYSILRTEEKVAKHKSV
jgi:hypothetical protein